ncbi:L-arabinose isomerase [Erysipelothrix sp. HDW6C]|nr:L-arabinose isomerase [Erysipelothrix sp. HDW6C]
MQETVKGEFWFVVGSVAFYGDESIQIVETQALEIIDSLNKQNLPYTIKFKGVLKSSDHIVNIMKEANYDNNVLGVMSWMHTFSPAKMWIKGMKLLQKPVVHIATQFNEKLPWDTIDMDFMNLNQSAHGDREYGYIMKRLNMQNRIVFGHWEQPQFIKSVKHWMIGVVGYYASKNVKVVRFGDNMRNVADTEGDKIEAHIRFGWEVDYYGVGDLVEAISNVSEADVDILMSEYREKYDFDFRNNSEAFFIKQLRYQAKIEHALLSFMSRHGYNAISTNFEDLTGLDQLPGFAIQRLNEKGIGFAGEGDWKTAALDRILKVMANNKKTGFMEDYTYNFEVDNEYIFQSHMLEVDPTLSATKPTIQVNPLGIGGKSDPARMVFRGTTGMGYVVGMTDMRYDFEILVNEVTAIDTQQSAPQLPVAQVTWIPKPNFYDGIQQWLELGGNHHTVVTFAVELDSITELFRLLKITPKIIR